MTVGGLAMIALGAFWVAVPSVLVPALLGVRGLAPRLVAAFVAGAANAVVVGTLLSFVDAFERPFLVVAHVVVGLAVVLVWQRAGRPAPFDRADLRGLLRVARAGAREHPIVAAAVIAAGAGLAIELFLGIAVAQNNWDVLSYHLSRAAYWLQYDSVSQFPGGTTRQLGYSPNAELMQAWTMELSGGDRFVAVVQWLSAAGMGLACYVAARGLGFERSGAILAGALLVAMPISIMQAATAQNDVVVSFFLLAAAAFTVRGLREGHGGELAMAGAALGLAVGTKNTGAMGVVAIGFIAAAVIVRHRPSRRALEIGAAAALVGILALGSVNYFANLRNTSTLTGHASDHLERDDPVVENTVRIAWGFADFPGTSVPWFDRVTLSTAPDVLGEPDKQGFAYAVDNYPDDSQSAFGPIGLFLLVLIVVVLVRRRTPLEQRAFAGAALFVILAVSVLVQWGPDITRVLLPAVAIAAPLLALVHRRESRTVAVVLSTLALASCLVVADGRNLIAPGDSEASWREDRLIQHTLKNPGFRGPLQRFAEELPPDAPVGFTGRDDSFDYPIFGEDLDRRVVRLKLEDADVTTARREGLAAIFFADVAPPADSGLQIESLGPGYSLGRP